ncbi:lipopolysaccharide biosynthesis protein [Microbacterium sp. NPDC057650]|uniref:lipopolysaccharide biosynthesis protein n=1 Tax=unclassified Microbacterium TaxID=2609290 RepID=UPI00366D2984
MTERAESLSGRVARGAAWSGASTIALRLGSLVVGIVIARILTPEQFGVYAVALTVQGILMTVADLGLSADVIRSDEPERIAPTIATLGLVSGATLTVITMVSSSALAGVMGSPEAGPAIAVLSLTLVLGGAGVVPFAFLTRRFQQRELFLVNLVDFTVSTVVTLSLISLGMGVMGLAIGRVVAQTVSLVMQFALARVRPRYSIDRSVLRPVLAFGLPIAAANLLSWGVLNVDNIVLVRIAGATALGFYVLAFNISSWPMTALGQVARAVTLPYFSRTEDKAGSLALMTALAWAGALPAGAVLAVLAAPLIEVVYGPKWLPAAPVLAALGVYGAVRVVFDVFAGFLYSQGRSRPVLWIQVIWLVALIAGMIAGTTAYGLVGAGWVHVLVAILIVLPAYLIALRRSGVAVGAVLRACMWPTVASVPAVAAALGARIWVPAPALSLVVGGLAAVLVYSACMFPWARKHLRKLRGAGRTTAVRAS